MRVVGAACEVARPHDDEAHAGRAFEALVGGRREARERQPREIDGDAAEGAHGVHVQAAAGSLTAAARSASGLRMPVVVSQ